MTKPNPSVAPTRGVDSDPGTATPNDRDERSGPSEKDAQHRSNRGTIERARRDVESGIQDTERIGTPSDVPSGKTSGT